MARAHHRMRRKRTPLGNGLSRSGPAVDDRSAVRVALISEKSLLFEPPDSSDPQRVFGDLSKMLIGYARTSTRDQNPAPQTDALTAAGCERIYQENASGAQRDRPQLAAALDQLRAGDTLIVWKLDRLARSIRQLIETVEYLRVRDIRLQVLTQQIDTTTSGGHLFFDILDAVAEFERELALERAQAGLTRARAMGRKGGRKPSMGEAEIRRAKAMLADPDITVEEIARQMGVQPSTLYRHIPGGRSAIAAGGSL